jgi:phosphatidylserine/phosphatidylglycerophosphate/cardiolipin synthase-like enzyme
MAAEPLSLPVRQDPPEKLVKRIARVATGVTNTIRVPHDRFNDRRGEWYTTVDMPSVVAGNQVKYLIDGNEAFKEMVAAMGTAQRAGHFIYMVNWFCDVDFHLLKSEEPDIPQTRTTLKSELTRASDAHVMIRAMFWKMPTIVLHQNEAAVDFLNSMETKLTAAGPIKVKKVPGLFNSAAIHDQRGDPNIPIPIIGILPRGFGAQHQKVLCIFGEQGLVCFCGGIDFNPDRIAADPNNPEKAEGGHPLHDVHCRIMGPAAFELVRMFELKWKDHRESAAIDERQGPLIIPPVPDAKGDHIVQIGRTFGRTGYRFIAPEHTAADMIAHAIRNAKRFIYTECQYFTGAPQLEAALKEALKRIEHLTVVLTHWEVSDLPTVNSHRREFIQSLKAAGGDKVRVFTLQPHGNTPEFQDGKVAHTYVHAKIWIIDDEFAVIGTVNSNRRSWSHDAEVAAGVYETSTDPVLHYRLAHWLRIVIWQEHLGMQTIKGSAAELADGVASAVHWIHRLPKARVRPYNLDERNRHNENDHGPNIGFLWDSVFDPS